MSLKSHEKSKHRCRAHYRMINARVLAFRPIFLEHEARLVALWNIKAKEQHGHGSTKLAFC